MNSALVAQCTHIQISQSSLHKLIGSSLGDTSALPLFVLLLTQNVLFLSFFKGWDPLLCRCYQERRQKCHPRNRILNKVPCQTWYTNTFEIIQIQIHGLDVSNLEYIWYTVANTSASSRTSFPQWKLFYSYFLPTSISRTRMREVWQSS